MKFRLIKNTPPPENYKFLRAAGLTHDQACEQLDICKGCFKPNTENYCEDCYAAIFEDEEQSP